MADGEALQRAHLGGGVTVGEMADEVGHLNQVADVVEVGEDDGGRAHQRAVAGRVARGLVQGE